eukprot:CAMPEP_0181506908 /NCGR_PEP_ID=MMETSP1110-20121109/58848_1 /TAXON_ID=174948 /ORGANISM="Symbiodinium sp., Strain CCMP421" /LENGTH=36 /DNA_ID= /DNA_START= /DNA_END= /DNA_ORIENTATION=
MRLLTSYSGGHWSDTCGAAHRQLSGSIGALPKGQGP